MGLTMWSLISKMRSARQTRRFLNESRYRDASGATGRALNINSSSTLKVRSTCSPPVPGWGCFETLALDDHLQCLRPIFQ